MAPRGAFEDYEPVEGDITTPNLLALVEIHRQLARHQGLNRILDGAGGTIDLVDRGEVTYRGETWLHCYYGSDSATSFAILMSPRPEPKPKVLIHADSGKLNWDTVNASVNALNLVLLAGAYSVSLGVIVR